MAGVSSIGAIGATNADMYLYNLSRTQQRMNSARTQSEPSVSSAATAKTPNTDTLQLSAKAQNVVEKSAEIISENASAATPKDNVADAVEQVNKQGEEKPDYRAVSLIKNSAIELPEPKPVETKQEAQSLNKAETVTAKQMNSANAQNFQASADTQPTETATVKQNVEIKRTQSGREQVSQKQQSKADEAAADNPTVKTSEQVAKTQSPKVTPAQARGIQAYQQVQSYSDALNMSNANSIA